MGPFKGNYYRRVFKYYVLILAPSLIGMRKKHRLISKKNFALNHRLKNISSEYKRFDSQIFVPKLPSVEKRQHHRLMHSYLTDRLGKLIFQC